MLFGKNNSAALAMRDPARASFLGAISGANFGRDRRPANGNARPALRSIDAIAAAAVASVAQAGASFGRDPAFGNDGWPMQPGYNFGQDPSFGADAPQPTPDAMKQAWFHKVRQDAANARRDQLLEPNKDVSTKVERYHMPTSQDITLGTALNPFTITAQPTVYLRPQRVTCNAPCPMFAFLTAMTVANVNVLVGPGVCDAWDFASEAQGTSLDIPTLSPSNPITIRGRYTGITPASYNPGLATSLCLGFIGWATITP